MACVFAFSFLAFFSSQNQTVYAVEDDVMVTKQDMADYRLATEDCSTPSLECLVKNVSRFTAIEWVQDIVGKKAPLCIEDDTCTSSSGTGTNVADYGAIGSLSNLIVAMYDNPVADTQTYVADVLKSAHIVTPAYAQGIGFASLDPVLNLWKTFRNIAYMFFVLIFVIVGFLIMFRQKVGQTAITAQQAIPQIIMSLVLVTFSYAIAGLLIDLMYVLMALIVGVFASFFPQDIFGYNIFELGGTMFKGAVNLQRNKDFISGFLESLQLGGTANQVVSIISGLTLTIILAVAMLIGIIRLFFELLKSYATIIIAVVMAPLLLMMGAIPGKSNAFGSWMKTLIGNLSPFPVILVVLVMYYAFTNGAIDASSGGFMPPFLLSAGNGIGESIIALMSLAIILALPDIVKKIKDGIAPKDPFAELVVGSAMKNVKQGMDYAENSLPLGIGAAKGAYGGLEAGVRSYKAGRGRRADGKGTMRHIFQDIKGGYTDSTGKTYGGFRPQFNQGIETGVKVRKVIDQIKDRRIFDPQDPAKLLQQIVNRGQNPGNTNTGGGSSTSSSGGGAPVTPPPP